MTITKKIKGLYITDRVIDERSDGVSKKVKMQIEALKVYNIETEIVEYVPRRNDLYNNLVKRLPYVSSNGKWKIENIEDVEYIYIRKPVIDRGFIKFISKIKKDKEIKIIFEFPTYPYDLEFSSLGALPIKYKEKYWRKHLYKYVDKIITSSLYDNILGVQTIKIQNGIDINRISLKEDSDYSRKNELNLLAVANISRWHGYDRIVNGLSSYAGKVNKSIDVIFHVVGEGKELANLKRLVEEKQVGKNVIFHGELHGKELDKVFNQCDIGIGSLGIHRIGLTQVSTLKLCEYCARGIPFIKGYEDKQFNAQEFRYMMDVLADESYIEIESIIKFYNQVCKEDLEEVRKNMRSYARDNLTWEIQMKPVANYLHDSNK